MDPEELVVCMEGLEEGVHHSDLVDKREVLGDSEMDMSVECTK